MDTTAATPASELLTTDELAAYLKVPVPTVRMWRHNGTGPKGVRLGRHVRYRRSDVDRWIENNERAQRPQRLDVCDGCGRPFLMNPKQRARLEQTPGTRTFCPDCREAGVPARMADQDRRARQRAARGK